MTGHAHGQQARSAAGRLADDLFLMAHEQPGGRLLLPERIAGLGLAAALLGELTLAARVEPRDGTVAVLDTTAREDELSDRLLEFLKQEQYPTRTWLAFFGQSAHAEIGRRMAADGLLVREPRKRARHSGRWVPTSPDIAVRPTALLCTQLIRHQELDERDLALVGLLRATGLDQPVLWEVRQSAPEALRHAARALGSLTGPLAELITQTEAAIGSAIAAHRF